MNWKYDELNRLYLQQNYIQSGIYFNSIEASLHFECWIKPSSPPPLQKVKDNSKEIPLTPTALHSIFPIWLQKDLSKMMTVNNIDPSLFWYRVMIK